MTHSKQADMLSSCMHIMHACIIIIMHHHMSALAPLACIWGCSNSLALHEAIYIYVPLHATLKLACAVHTATHQASCGHYVSKTLAYLHTGLLAFVFLLYCSTFDPCRQQQQAMQNA